MKRKLIIFSLVLFLVADFTFAFLQFYNMPLDGDMTGGIIPASDVKSVLNSPLGFDVFIKHKNYPNPNRYFSHASFKLYFSTVPFFIQRFTDPITSLYLSCAIVKLFLLMGLIFVFSCFINRFNGIFNLYFLKIMVFITPLFQLNYYKMDIAIIDKSTLYCFFYAIPFLFFLLYLMPFVKSLFLQNKESIPFFIKIFWIPFALAISLSSPLNPGISLVFSLIIFGVIFFKNFKSNLDTNFFHKLYFSFKSIPNYYWFYLVPLCG